jgi:uncharacterized protein YcgI (DUF1989 family)
MIDLDTFELRDLQKEAARALSSMEATNNNIYKFNQQAHHNSQSWYKTVIQWYIEEHGGMPSQVGPGATVKLILE